MRVHSNALWVTIGLMASAGAQASLVSLTGPPSAAPGGTVAVTIALAPELSGVYALQAGLTYDPAVLTPVPNQDATAPQGFHPGTPGNTFPNETIPKDADLFRLNAGQSGRIVLGYVKNPADPAGSPSNPMPAQAVQILFEVAQDAPPSTTLQLEPYVVHGQTLPAVILGAQDGSPLPAGAGPALTISLGTTPARLPGDANADGLVNVEDVILALQTAGGAIPPGGSGLNILNADVWPPATGDGKVTLEDAVRIWRRLNGLESGLE
jgi:hypothetical protein